MSDYSQKISIPLAAILGMIVSIVGSYSSINNYFVKNNPDINIYSVKKKVADGALIQANISAAKLNDVNIKLLSNNSEYLSDLKLTSGSCKIKENQERKGEIYINCGNIDQELIGIEFLIPESEQSGDNLILKVSGDTIEGKNISNSANF